MEQATQDSTLQRNFPPEKISLLYQELSELKSFELPNTLFDGGFSTYQKSVDILRAKQSRLAEIIMDVDKEYQLVNQKFHLLNQLLREQTILNMELPDVKMAGSLWARKTRAEQKARTKYKLYDELAGYRENLWSLRDTVKFIYNDLTRARTDLKLKIHLLDMEAGMQGSAPKASVKGTSAKKLNDEDWKNLTDEKKEMENE